MSREVMSDEQAKVLAKMLVDAEPILRCLSCGRDVDVLYQHKPLFETLPDGKKIRYTLEAVEYKHLIGLCKECSELVATLRCNDILREFEESVRGKHN